MEHRKPVLRAELPPQESKSRFLRERSKCLFTSGCVLGACCMPDTWGGAGNRPELPVSLSLRLFSHWGSVRGLLRFQVCRESFTEVGIKRTPGRAGLSKEELCRPAPSGKYGGAHGGEGQAVFCTTFLPSVSTA